MMGLALVTGARGAIGQVVIKTLSQKGWNVVGLGHGLLRDELPIRGWINGELDAANLSALSSRWGRPDAVIHLAGGSAVGPSLVAPAEDFNRTTATCVRLLDWIRTNAPQAAVVMASSAAVYGDLHRGHIAETSLRTPLSPYGYHKAMMEMAAESWAHNFGLNVAIVRLFSVYGPTLRKQLVFEICKRIAEGSSILSLGGTGKEMRDWLHINDAAAMLVGALAHASPQAPVINGCTGQSTSVENVSEFVTRGTSRQVTFEFSGVSRPGDPVSLVGDPTRARSMGLCATIEVEQGISTLASLLVRELSHSR